MIDVTNRLFEELWVLLFKNYGNQELEKKIIGMQKLLESKSVAPEILSKYYSAINNVVIAQIIWCVIAQKPLDSLLYLLKEIMTTNSRNRKRFSAVEGIANISEWDGFSILLKFLEVSPEIEKKRDVLQILDVLLFQGRYALCFLRVDAGLRAMGAKSQNRDRLYALRQLIRNPDLVRHIELLIGTIKKYKQKGKSAESR